MTRFKYIMAIALMAAMTISCSRGKEWHKESGAVWATQYNITYLADRDLTDSIQEVFRQVELSLSPFNPQSRISLINRGESMQTDTLINYVTDISQQVNRASGGMFDPTVSPLVNLWGFGYTGHPADGQIPAPSQAQIDSALTLVGIADCHITGGMMVKKAPGTTFNFSAVTKGYGCDLVGEMLRRNGCTDFLVEIGGEMTIAGSNPRGEEWRVQIDAPVPDTDAMHRAMSVISVTDCGVATSGNYRNFLTDTAGNRYGHTISPVTGRPTQTAIISATVIAPACALADALATACMASTPDDARRMLGEFPSVKALLVTPDADSLHLITINFPPLR